MELKESQTNKQNIVYTLQYCTHSRPDIKSITQVRDQTDKQMTMMIISAQSSPQISASVPHSRHPPLRWEHCSTPLPPGTITYTWKRETRREVRWRKGEGGETHTVKHCEIRN